MTIRYDKTPEHYMNVYVANKDIVFVYGLKALEEALEENPEDFPKNTPEWIQEMIENGDLFRQNENPDTNSWYVRGFNAKDYGVTKLTHDYLIVKKAHRDRCTIADIMTLKEFEVNYSKVNTMFFD